MNVARCVLFVLLPFSSTVTAGVEVQTRAALDLAVRSEWPSGGSGTQGALYAGFDGHAVLSRNRGDFGTALVQLYVTKISNFSSPPRAFDHANDTEVIFRNLYFNWTGRSRRTNVRLGHFEVPYGLEQIENTNGTLRQLMHTSNFGMKGDWGIALNGESSHLEYDLAWTRGTGNTRFGGVESGLVAASVGSRRDASFVLGLSGLTGAVQTDAGPIDRHRVALDWGWYWRRLSFLGEVGGGRDDDGSARQALIELGIESGDGSWTSYTQFRYLDAPARRNALTTALGMTYSPDPFWTFSGELSRSNAADAHGGLGARLQLRYRISRVQR